MCVRVCYHRRWHRLSEDEDSDDVLEAERFAREAHDAGIHYDLEALSVDTLRQLPQQVSAIPPFWLGGWMVFVPGM